jgi:LysR family transcriptional regulator of abg operon
MFEMRQIQYFEAVYRLRSFSQAADEMNLTHAALTKSIKGLEARWGVQLFQRTTRQVTPTAAGHRLYEKVPSFLAEAASLQDVAAHEQRHVKLMCGPVILETLVHPALLALREKYPTSRFSAATKPPLLAMEDVLGRRADLMLIHENTHQALPNRGQLEITPLVNEPYKVACRHGHAALHSKRQFSDIVVFDWAVAGFDMIFEQNLPATLNAELQAHGFPKYRLLSQTACLDMVRQSDVLTLIPQRSAARFENDLEIALFDFPLPLRFSICAARRSQGLRDPLLDAFVAALCEPSSL